VFNIVDDEPAPANEWLPYLAATAGAKPPMRIPKWLARLLAGDVVVAMMTEGRGFSNAKAKHELGWQPRYPSWREGFRASIAPAQERKADRASRAGQSPAAARGETT
jgi:nucleoside-diphosphate-sugar epimerase